MSRTMVILHAIVTAFIPAHRPVVAHKDNRPIEAHAVGLQDDAEELEQGAREQSHRSTCILIATAERILHGHKPEQLNGHGEHKSGLG
jgi:hypothetical protein